jgi:hypothetical protein
MSKMVRFHTPAWGAGGGGRAGRVGAESSRFSTPFSKVNIYPFERVFVLYECLKCDTSQVIFTFFEKNDPKAKSKAHLSEAFSLFEPL